MRVLVTGGGGFIGSHVIDHLLAGGVDVVALRRTSPSSGPPFRTAPVDWRTCDLNDLGGLRALFRDTRPDVCIHAAWFTDKQSYPYSAANLDILHSSLPLVMTAAEEGCRRFIGVGTCAEYESLTSPLREDSRTLPQTLYGASKLALRHLGETVARPLGMQFAWARIFYVYGPREDWRRVVPAVINTILDGKIFAATTGEQVRDFLHAEDVASAFVTLCNSREEGVFNICSSQPTTMRSLLTTLATVMHSVDRVCFGAASKHTFDPPYVVGDNSRLRSLGWQPRHTLQQGLLQTIDWWRQKRAGMTTDVTPRPDCDC